MLDEGSLVTTANGLVVELFILMLDEDIIDDDHVEVEEEEEDVVVVVVDMEVDEAE